MLMVRSYRSPSVRAQQKVPRVYPHQAACLVLDPQDRMDLAQFCLLLLQAQQKQQGSPKQIPEKNLISRKTIRLRKSKTSFAGQEGSQISGPYYLKSNLIIKIKLFIKNI